MLNDAFKGAEAQSASNAPAEANGGSLFWSKKTLHTVRCPSSLSMLGDRDAAHMSEHRMGSFLLASCIFRAVCLAFMFSMAVYAAWGNAFRWSGFLTNWGWCFVMFYLAASLIINIRLVANRRAGESVFKTYSADVTPSMLRLHQVATILFQLALVFQIVVVLLYWTLLFPSAKHQSLQHFLFAFTFHSFGAFVMLIEFIFTTVPVSKRHTFVTAMITLSYAPWNFIVGEYTGRLVYHIFTWKDLKSVFLILLVIVCMIGLHSLLAWVVRGPRKQLHTFFLRAIGDTKAVEAEREEESTAADGPPAADRDCYVEAPV